MCTGEAAAPGNQARENLQHFNNFYIENEQFENFLFTAQFGGPVYIWYFKVFDIDTINLEFRQGANGFSGGNAPLAAI